MSSAADERWQNLYRRVDQERAEREKLVGQNRTGEAAKADFDAWCASVAKGVMDSIHEHARERIEQFRLETGTSIVLTYPSQAPNAQVAQAAAEMIFLKLALDRARVHLYSARSTSKLPAFHLVSAVERLRPAAGGARPARDSMFAVRDRFVSKTVGRAVQTDERAFVLEERGSSAAGAGAVLDVDVVVFKAVDMLVKLWRRSQKQA